MENETVNPLKTPGDNCEHHDGHGTQQLSVVCAIVMLLAFWVDQTPQRCCAFCRAVWAKLGSKRLLWARMRALFYADAFAALRQRFATLWSGFKKSSPMLAMDAS